MSRFPLRATAVLAAAALVLGGCGDSSTKDGGDALAKVTVADGGAKKPPTVTLPEKPFAVTATTKRVLKEGTGAEVLKDSLVKMNAAVVNGKDGKVVNSTYEQQPAGIDLDNEGLFASLRSQLPGTKVGSRLLIASTPEDAFGKQGNTELGIGAGDSVLFVVDVLDVIAPLKEATGTAVAPKPGLPTVAMTPGKPAAVTIPKKAKAPTKLVVQPLIEGKGPVVKQGQVLRASYTGLIWGSGKIFDATANNGNKPADFPIGVGRVVPGWDKGLVGQKVGSRVLLVLPPAMGYGTQGNSGAGIKGTDTLVFVVDILAAY